MNAIKNVCKWCVVIGIIASAAFGAVEPAVPLDVRDFGAVGDGVADDTEAFQRALAAATTSTMQTVVAPRGQYRLTGSLNIPVGVTLKGLWESVPAHNGIRDRGTPRPTDDGTTLLVEANTGNEDAEPLITLNTNSTLKGVCIYYPLQPTDDVPTPYPWCVAMRGKNPAILDCELLNPYRGIETTSSERFLIRNISGQPLRMGVYVDAIYDIGRIENVHFNPWWSMKQKLLAWQMDNGEAFVFGRTDWQYVLNTFCFGYKIGYHFIETKSGSCNGNFLGIGADDCQTAVVVDQCAPMGLLITNGEFVSFHGPEPTMVRVAETNKGVVRFSNCAFWGPCRQIGVVEGSGTVGFSDCTFVQWGFRERDDQNNRRRGYDRTDDPALKLLGGTVLVRGCEFRENRPQILIGEDVVRGVITDNVIAGRVQIAVPVNAKASIIIGNNAGE